MKGSPAPIILAVVLGLLAISAGTLAFLYPATIDDATSVPSELPKQNNPKKVGADDLQSRLQPLKTPALWNSPPNGHHLFISDGFLFYPSSYPTGDYIQKNDGSARTPRGVLISWYQKYGIDFTDPNVDRSDPDNDGFSNAIEFENGMGEAKDLDGSKASNPLDGQSHPPYLGRIRLERYESRAFHIQFLGYQVLNGQNLFQIFLQDVSSSQQPGYKKTGDLLGFEGYTIGPFVQNIVQQENAKTHVTETVDKSTLELDKADIGFKILLPYREQVDSPESTANLVMLMPSEVGKVLKVARGKTFTMPYLTGQEFLLIDVKDTGATIRETKSRQDILVPKLDPKEWDDVPTTAAVAGKQP